MAFLINWNWQKFTPGQCDMGVKCLYSYMKNPKTTFAVHLEALSQSATSFKTYEVHQLDGNLTGERKKK